VDLVIQAIDLNVDRRLSIQEIKNWLFPAPAEDFIGKFRQSGTVVRNFRNFELDRKSVNAVNISRRMTVRSIFQLLRLRAAAWVMLTHKMVVLY